MTHHDLGVSDPPTALPPFGTLTVPDEIRSGDTFSVAGGPRRYVYRVDPTPDGPKAFYQPMFGVSSRHLDASPGSAVRPASPAGWLVGMPHSCDEWMIAGEWKAPAAQDEAVALLDAFIAEAVAVRDALAAGRAVDGGAFGAFR